MIVQHCLPQSSCHLMVGGEKGPHKQAAPVSFILMDIQEMKGLLRWWPLRFSHCNHQIALLEASPLLKGGALAGPPSSILLHSSEFDCNKAHNSNHKQQHKLQQKRIGMPFALRGEDDDADWKEKKLLTCLAGVYLHAKLLQDARWSSRKRGQDGGGRGGGNPMLLFLRGGSLSKAD